MVPEGSVIGSGLANRPSAYWGDAVIRSSLVPEAFVPSAVQTSTTVNPMSATRITEIAEAADFAQLPGRLMVDASIQGSKQAWRETRNYRSSSMSGWMRINRSLALLFLCLS